MPNKSSSGLKGARKTITDQCLLDELENGSLKEGRASEIADSIKFMLDTSAGTEAALDSLETIMEKYPFMTDALLKLDLKLLCEQDGISDRENSSTL